MAEKSILYDDFWRQFHESEDIGDILDLLKNIEGLRNSKELPKKESHELRIQAFLALKELTAESPEIGQDLILDYLLPECLKYDPDARYELHQYRECLEDWLNEYPETKRIEIRERILKELYSRLNSSEPLTACWLVWRLGYRDQQAVDALMDIIERDKNRLGNTALATRTALGIEEHTVRETILEKIHKRAAIQGYQIQLASAMIHLADSSTAKVVYEHWLKDSNSLTSLQRSSALGVLMRVLDVNYNNENLQGQVWRWLIKLVEANPSELSPDIFLSQMGPNCNSEFVIPTILDWLGTPYLESVNRYVIGLRLEECVRPRQLLGWRQPLRFEATKILQQEACQNTGADGYYTTEEDMIKTKAWETALRAGHQDALNWLEAAVLPEKSRFMQEKILEWFSCFQIVPLPDFICKWITEEYDRSEDEGDSRELSRRIAATRMARSSASREAFDVLSNFGLNNQGKALMHSVYALNEVTLNLIRRGETEVINRLVHIVNHSSKEYQRSAAAYSMEHVAKQFPDFLQRHIEQIVPAILDESRAPYERSSLVRSLAYLEDWEIPNDLLNKLEKWSYQPDRWLGGASLEVLAHRGYAVDNDELLSDVLGLRRIGTTWDIDQSKVRFDWAPFIIGLLYYKHGEPFVPAIVSSIKNLNSLSIPQVYDWLVEMHGYGSQVAPSQVIIDALIERARRTQTGTHSETRVFRVLGEIAPEALALKDWSDIWDDWLPDSRIALADALGQAQLGPDSHKKCTSHLQSLTADSQYGVRRSAFRSLGQHSMDALLGLCLAWSVSEYIELRQRAAEGSGWLDCEIEIEGGKSDAFEILHQDLSDDVEKSVREASKRAWEERRRRSWANEYLSIVLGVKGDSNSEILDAWCYGDAFTQVGDDRCIRLIREHLSQRSLPPNVKYWLKQILEKTQENWRKTTQDWPDPWFGWEGLIDEGHGRIIISEDKNLEVDYSIWAQPQSVPLDPAQSSWGGAVWAVPFRIAHDLLNKSDKVILELEEGLRGEVLVKKISGEKVVFLGSGRFPRQS